MMIDDTPHRRAAARIIPALDVSSADALDRLLAQLAGEACWAKVGLELYSVLGAAVVAQVVAAGLRVMLDLKFHDIPRTVERAVRAQVTRPGIGLLTVHAGGGRAMIAAAVAAAHEAPHPARVLAVTVLTSLGDDEAREVFGAASAHAAVMTLARMAQDAGADGVVASPREAADVRLATGPDFLIVTPGIRPGAVEPGDDQRRVTTVAEAARVADFLVIGRPIVEAADPAAALRALAADMVAAPKAPA